MACCGRLQNGGKGWPEKKSSFFCPSLGSFEGGKRGGTDSASLGSIEQLMSKKKNKRERKGAFSWKGRNLPLFF